MKNGLASLLALLGVIWLVSLVNIHSGQALSPFGIQPRRLEGLVGLVTWPFLHGSYLHLLQNTTPLLLLGGVVVLQDERWFARLTLYVSVAGGWGVWLFGRQAVHIGASGLVFGYFGYILARGVYDRGWAPLMVALGALLMYGGMLWGVLPSDPNVSWEGHLFGLLAGAIYGRAQSLRGSRRRRRS